MKFLAVFRKSFKDQTRDLLILSLSLAFAPFFVFLYWLFFPSGSTTYAVLARNNDISVQTSSAGVIAHGDRMIDAMANLTYPNGNPILKVSRVADQAEAETKLRDRDAAVLMIIPENFSQTIQDVLAGNEPTAPTVTVVGDLTNPTYIIAAMLAMTASDQYIQVVTQRQPTLRMLEVPLGASAARSEFDLYIPGLLVFSVILLIFLAAMTIAREVEAGTLRRLQISRMTALDFLGGTSASIVLMGVAQVLLTFVTAWVLGFRSQGPLWVAILVGIATSFSVIGVGLIVASFSKTVTQAFLIANFPLILFMFFSGSIFPIPRIPLFTLAGHNIGLYDLLPPTHAVMALNKVLTLGMGLGDVTYELTALLILSVLYFVAGIWLFKRMHLKAL